MKKFTLLLLMFTCTGLTSFAQIILGGVKLGNLPKYLFVFTDGRTDANWQAASKGYIGDVAVNGVLASERTSGDFAYAGKISTNDNSLNGWSNIVGNNPGQASAVLSQGPLLGGLKTDLDSVFIQINALSVTPGFESRTPTSLHNLNTKDGIAQRYVINLTSDFTVSDQITFIGDEDDFFIFRWDSDRSTVGYDGQVKFQSGGAFVPGGNLRPTNFLHVAGDINASGGGENPPFPYPDGPKTQNGRGTLIEGGSLFNGGGFFTGYWFTTGSPTLGLTTGLQPYGESSSLSNAIFVGGWYSKNTRFSMTSGTSGVYVTPPPVHGLTATATPGDCQTATNEYTLSGVISLTNITIDGIATITDGPRSTTVAVPAYSSSIPYSLTGLVSGTDSHTVNITLPGCGSASVTYTAPASCTATPNLILNKLVSKSKASLGEVVSYTVILANTGPGAASNVVVNDNFTEGLKLIPQSISVSTGSFTPGMDGGTWAISRLPANTTATLTFSGSLIQEGVTYNTASIPGQEVRVCTSVPFRVCKDIPFALELSAPAGYERYEWAYKAPGANVATVVYDGPRNSFTATQAGEYSLMVNHGTVDACPNLSCCPIYIEETEVPHYTATPTPPTCVGKMPQENGKITLTDLGSNPGEFTFSVSKGATFDESTATAPQPVPANGELSHSLEEGSYTVRVSSGLGCYRDATVTLTANCVCNEVCVPVTLKKTRLL